MAKYKIAWLPGDGIGIDVMEAAKIVLDRSGFDAEYIHGDIGWEFWCKEGDAFPQRTVDLLRNVDASLFGAITSKPVKAAETELVPELKGKGLVYRSPIVRMRQLFDLYICLRPCKGYPATRSTSRRASTSWCSARTPRTSTPASSSTRCPPSCADTLAKLSKPFAAFKDLPLDEYAISLQDQHPQGLGAHHPGRLRVRPEARAQEGHRRPQGQRGARHRRAVPGDRQGGRQGLSRASPWTTPTSTPCACGCSRTPSTTTSWWRPISTATSSPTCAPRWSADSASAARGNIGEKLAVFEPTHGSAPKYAGQYKVNPIATILAAKMMLDWLGETSRGGALEGPWPRSSREGKVRTYDMGGANKTLEMAEPSPRSCRRASSTGAGRRWCAARPLLLDTRGAGAGRRVGTDRAGAVQSRAPEALGTRKFERQAFRFRGHRRQP